MRGQEDGWGWIFPAVDHWNAECVGWHVCKKGDRFAALEHDQVRLTLISDDNFHMLLPTVILMFEWID